MCEGAVGGAGAALARQRVAVAELVAIAEEGAARLAAGTALPAEPGPQAEGAVLFTSGSTGPAKGVVYTHGQLAQLAQAMGGSSGSGGAAAGVGVRAVRAVRARAGATCVVPAMDVTKPATLTASALADAVAAAAATSVFLSPAAVVNVLATAGGLDGAQRAALGTVTTLLSAGAVVPTPLLQRVRELMPLADPRTPYGPRRCCGHGRGPVGHPRRR